MFFCHLLVVFLLGTVANGMATSHPTTESTIPYVSTIDSTTDPSSTSSPSSTASPTVHITTVEHLTESTPEESTTTLGESTTNHIETESTSASPTMTTETASSHPPTESSITHSTTILGDTTTSEKSTSSTTRPDDSSSPHSGTTPSTESTTPAEPTTKLTTETGNPSSTVLTTSPESTTPAEPTTKLTTETGNPSSTVPTTSPESTTPAEPTTTPTTETDNPSSAVPTTSPESTSPTETTTTLTTETDDSSSTVPTTSPESTTPAEPATTLTTETVTDRTTQTTSVTVPTVPTSTIPSTSGSTAVTVKPTGTTMRPTDNTNNSTTAPPQTTTLTPPFITCPAKPCPVESVCLDGTCQCLSGTFLQNGRCVQAQVFPGRLHLTSLKFESEMSDRSSAIFLSTAANISETLRKVLSSQRGYLKSDVVQLTEGSVQATVNNIFEETNATQESVDNAINQAINESTTGLLANAEFTVTELCKQKPVPCDVTTTDCSERSGRAFCSCKSGYISNVYSNSSCSACPSGQMAVGDACKQCQFGYAGFNCSDSSLLAVVVISCVLGGVLLIMVLALFTYGGWRRHSKKKNDFNNSPYPVENLSQPWPMQGITPIPRATTKWDAAPPIEMTEAGSTNTLVDKNNQTNGLTGSYDLNPEQMKTFKGKNPSRYSYLVQGHENPYFIPGDEKRN